MSHDQILADLKALYGEKTVLSPRDIAAQLGRTPQAIANLKHRGTLPFPTVDVGGSYGVSIYDFADWLAGGSKPKGAKAKASAPPPVPPPANRRKNLAAILLAFTNTLTMWLTLATFIGYAVIYTVVLKPATPQNIVIGGASGAMPPVLGWAAMTGQVSPEALILFLIIFLWTPPHFWALALYRVDDYRKSGLPMLPVTHGAKYTQLQILLYTLVLFAGCLLPVIFGMSGWLYFTVASALCLGFSWYALRLWMHYSDALARKTFRFSLIHLSGVFAALLIDHYLVT